MRKRKSDVLAMVRQTLGGLKKVGALDQSRTANPEGTTKRKKLSGSTSFGKL